MIPANKLGWMAGVIDLKGAIVIKNNKQRVTQQIVLVVNSRSVHIIRELCSFTGTNPKLYATKDMSKIMRRGCSDHCPEAHIHLQQDYPQKMPTVARWTITGAGAGIVLYNVLPFLVDYKDYPELLKLIAENTPLDGQGAHAVSGQVKRLNSLGWDVPEPYDRFLTIQNIIEFELEKLESE